MKPNINDPAKRNELKTYLAEERLPARVIGILTKALDRGMVFNKPEPHTHPIKGKVISERAGGKMDGLQVVIWQPRKRMLERNSQSSIRTSVPGDPASTGRLFALLSLVPDQTFPAPK